MCYDMIKVVIFEYNDDVKSFIREEPLLRTTVFFFAFFHFLHHFFSTRPVVKMVRFSIEKQISPSQNG